MPGFQQKNSVDGSDTYGTPLKKVPYKPHWITIYFTEDLCHNIGRYSNSYFYKSTTVKR